jgi:hypothetical protein
MAVLGGAQRADGVAGGPAWADWWALRAAAHSGWLLAGGGAAAGAHCGSTGLFPVPDPRACRQGVGCGLRVRTRWACRARRRARLLGVARRSARWRAPCPTRTAPSRPSLGGDLGTTLRAGLAVSITPRCIPPVESLGGARRVGGPPWCNPRWTTVAFGVGLDTRSPGGRPARHGRGGAPYWSSPSSRARATAWVRLAAPSLARR